MKRKILYIGIPIIALIGITIGLANFLGDSNTNSNIEKPHLTVYKSPQCGCCGNYIAYLKQRGFEVTVENKEDMSPIKEKYNIPHGLQSCHTTDIGDYVVEGHVPTEAIKKLLEEKPDIYGIALRGMPSGSPGMPGGKHEPFSIQALSKDGDHYLFMDM